MGANVGQVGLFECDGRWYELVVSMTHPEIKGVGLDLQHVVSFEYVNSFNSCFLTGELLFVDTNGEVGRYLNRLYTHVQITVTQKKKVGSGGDATFENESRGKYTTFFHEFLVDNFEILTRDNSEILYRLYLVSNQWYLYCTCFSFSNYDKAPGSDERKVFNIIKTGLDNAQIPYDPKSFGPQRSKIEVPYITNGNDTVLSAIKYLLNASYYSAIQQEEYLKFIIYDPFDGKPGCGMLKCFDFGDPSTFLKNDKAQILVSLFDTSFETFFGNEQNNFASVIKKPATEMYENFFLHNLWHLDREKSIFSLEPEDTTKLSLLANNIQQIRDAANGTPKYEELNSKWFINQGKYLHNGSDWNGSFSIYSDMVTNLLDRDSIIINTAGEQTHQPGTALDIELDRTVLKNQDTQGEHRQTVIKGHRQLESLWIITKARHIYRSAPPSSYRENLILSRNYTIPAEAEVVPSGDI